MTDLSVVVINYNGIETVLDTIASIREQRAVRPRIFVLDGGYQFGWGCDGELFQRLWMVGYKCLYVPSAVDFHEYKPFDESRHYRARGQVYNRWRYVLTHYERRTLVLTAPALVACEGLQAAFCVFKGAARAYARGILDVLRDLPAVRQRRTEVQALRVRADKELLAIGPLYVRPADEIWGKLVSAAVKAATATFDAYWWLVQPLLSESTAPPMWKREERRDQEVLAS